MDVASLSSKLGTGAVRVLDVRSAAERETGGIPGALHIPLGDLPIGFPSLPLDGPLVVHCQAGARSAIAASLVNAQTAADVAILEGGFGAWQAAGYPSEHGGSEKGAEGAGAPGQAARIPTT